MRFAGVTVEPDYVGLEALAGLVDSGQLHPNVAHELPQLTRAAQAHELIESGHATGKVVLTT